MEVLEAIQKRRTVRVPFIERKVPEADIEALLDISTISPDGDAVVWRMSRAGEERIKAGLCTIVREDFGDFFQKDAGRFREVFSRYPDWIRFSESRDGVRLDRTPKIAGYFLRAAMGGSLGPVLGRLGVMAPEINAYCRNIRSAPEVFGVFMDRSRETARSGMRQIWNAGAMLQNLRLAASSLGLSYQDLSWTTATEPAREKARILLDLPKEYTAVHFFRVGYADGKVKQTKRSDFRRDLRDVVHAEEFGRRCSFLPVRRTSLSIGEAICGKSAEKRTGSITEEDIGYLLEAARWTPTSFNAQPFEFVVAGRKGGKNITIIEDKERDTPDPGPCKSLVQGALLQNIRLAARALGLECSCRQTATSEGEGLRRQLLLPPHYSARAVVEVSNRERFR